MVQFSNLDYKYPTYTGPHFMCCYCQTMFISEEFLDKHQKKCIQMKLHMILKTKLQVRRNNTLNEDDTRHQTTDETWGDYFCDECFSGFLKLSEYESHMHDLHPMDLSFQCDHCDRKYSNKTSLQRHIVMIHGIEKPFECDLSSKSSKEQTELSIHNLSHTVEWPFDCPNCPKKFLLKEYFIQHLLTHSNKKKSYDCDRCDKSFTDNCNLKKHLLAHMLDLHPIELPFQCVHCDRKFSNKTSLQRHIVLIHGIEKPFEPDISSKSSKKKPELSIHSLEFFTIPCPHCPKKFPLKENFIQHLLSHINDLNKETFVCYVCNKTFSQNSRLQKHLLTHSREKSFDCDYVVENGFSSTVDFNRHMVSRSRSFSCNHCDMRFLLKTHLDQHSKTHR